MLANFLFSNQAPPLSSTPDTEPASPVSATSSAVNPGIDMDAKAALEQKYIQLLEQRIAQLEALVNSSPKDDEAEKSKEEKAKEDDKTTDKGKSKSTTDKDASKEVSRFRNVISRWNTESGKRVDSPVNEVPEPKSCEEGEVEEDYAFTFRRVMDYSDSRKLAYSEIDIHSSDLKDLLMNEIGTDHPGQRWGAETINMIAKFSPIVHNWDKLKEASTKVDGNDSEKKKLAREDLGQLLQQVETCSELEAYFKTRRSNLESSTVTYQTLWTLFPPKTKVFAKPFMNLPQIFEVKTPPDPWEEKVKIKCWGYDWDGKNWIDVHFEFPIDKFHGARDVNSLFCYPLSYYKNDAGEKDSTKLEEELIKRGRRFHELYCVEKGAKQMFDYSDLALSQGPGTSISSLDRDDDGRSRRSEEDERTERLPRTNPKIMKVKGRFMVDAAAFLQFGPGFPLLERFVPTLIEESSSGVMGVPDSDQYLCCPPRVLGYATKSKAWGQFKVESTKEVKSGHAAEAFKDKLELEDHLKDMIIALVENHESGKKQEGKATVNDIVGGKGKSLIMLFHGPPGVGKTLTAETIAERTGKPLFIASVAEIGLDASKAERNLEQMFHLAGAWEAILLIDEADVFLESRTRDGDPNRNALVSVLLRVLEYYQGIMILTTNRITSLDMAVQSRIHLAIRYDDLDKEQKKRIFYMFLDQLSAETSRHDMEIIKEWVSEYGSEHKLNGRQIRNVISSAQALARSHGGTLKKDHIKKVMDITKSFQEQLDKLMQASRAQNEVEWTGRR